MAPPSYVKNDQISTALAVVVDGGLAVEPPAQLTELDIVVDDPNCHVIEVVFASAVELFFNITLNANIVFDELTVLRFLKLIVAVLPDVRVIANVVYLLPVKLKSTSIVVAPEIETTVSYNVGVHENADPFHIKDEFDTVGAVINAVVLAPVW